MMEERAILVLGLGNVLLSDDGVGVHVIRALAARHPEHRFRHPVLFRDGGTLGLSLLPEIGASEALVVVDAARFGGEAGEVRRFEGEAMDAQLGVRRGSAHEIALCDLMGASRLCESLPRNRALVGIEPGCTQWGLEPTPDVASSISRACDAIEDILQRWSA